MMKTLRNLIGLWLLVVGVAQAQNCPEYDQLIKDGDRFRQQRLYHQALKKYSAAGICSRNKSAVVAKYIDELFVAIEHEKDEAVAALAARAKAEANIQQMADLIGKINDFTESEKTAGIAGFATFEHGLYEILLPYHQYIIKNSVKLDKPWQTALIHLHVGISAEDVNSIQSEQELNIAFTEMKKAAAELIAKKKPIPIGLHRGLIEAAVYHAWSMMNKNEIAQAQAILFAVKNMTEQQDIIKNARLIYSHAKLENALSRLFFEKKMIQESLRYQKKAVDLVKEAVDLEKENLVYKSSLSVYLRNLSTTSDTLMKQEAKSLLNAEGCQLARVIDNTEGSGIIALKTVMNCILDESYVLVSQKKTDKAINSLQQAIGRLDNIIDIDPANTYYLYRSRLNMRLSEIEINRNNEALRLSYLKTASTDWLKAINGKPILPQETWMLKSVYEGMRLTAQAIESQEEKKIFFKKIAEAIDSIASIYGNVSAIGMIAADSYAQVGEYMKAEKQNTDTVLFYLTKAIGFLNKAKLVDESLAFDERTGWLCRAYRLRLQLYCEREDTMRAVADLNSITTVFGPVLDRYPFDFYLRAEFWSSYLSVGELLFKKGQFKKAEPILQYASDWGEKTATLYLASIYREGKVGKIDTAKAAHLEKIAPGQSMKKITIPCNFNGETIGFPFYVRDITKDAPYKGIDDQIEWVKRARGGKVSDEVGSSFRKLHDIARENNVSFPDLCVYALGDDGSEEKFKEFTQKITASKDSTEKLNLYKDLTALYEEKMKTDSKKILYTKKAAEAYMDYSKFLERNNKTEEASAKINRAYALDSTNVDAYRYSRELVLNHTKESLSTLTQKSSEKELLAYMYGYLKKGNRKNADLLKNKILSQKDTPSIRDQIQDYYALFNYDIFKELFLAKPGDLTVYQDYFLRKDTKDETNSEKITHNQNLIKIEEALLKTKPTPELKLQIAQHYNSVVWYNLLEKNFQVANLAVQQGLTFDASQPYLLGNQPHTLLFTGKVQEAKELYLKLKDKKFDEKAGLPFYKDAFLDDFQTFEKLGITHPDLEEIKALLEG